MHVSITTNQIKFDLTFSGKFNILLGPSGSKKTLLLTSLMKWKRGIRKVHGKIEDTENEIPKNKIHVFTNDTIIEGDYHNVFNSVGDIYFIDESCSVLHEREIASVLKRSRNYFVIVSRSVAGWLPISIDSIYQLENIKGVLRNVPVYCKKNSDLTKLESEASRK